MRVESFVRPVLVPIDRTALERLPPVRDRLLRSAPTRLANRLRTVGRLCHRRVGDVRGLPAAVAAATIDPTNSQLAFPPHRRTTPRMSPADSRRAITAACVMATAAPRCSIPRHRRPREIPIWWRFSAFSTWQLVRDHLGRRQFTSQHGWQQCHPKSRGHKKEAAAHERGPPDRR